MEPCVFLWFVDWKLWNSRNNIEKSVFGPSHLLNWPSKAAKLTLKRHLGALKLAQERQKRAPGVPQDLPGRPLEHPWAPSRDPWDSRIAPRETLWEEKAAQGGSKPGKTETSKTLEKPRFFNGFSCFFRVPGCCYSCLFRKKLLKSTFTTEFWGKNSIDC